MRKWGFLLLLPILLTGCGQTDSLKSKIEELTKENTILKANAQVKQYTCTQSDSYQVVRKLNYNSNIGRGFVLAQRFSQGVQLIYVGPGLYQQLKENKTYVFEFESVLKTNDPTLLEIDVQDADRTKVVSITTLETKLDMDSPNVEMKCSFQ